MVVIQRKKSPNLYDCASEDGVLAWMSHRRFNVKDRTFIFLEIISNNAFSKAGSHIELPSVNSVICICEPAQSHCKLSLQGLSNTSCILGGLESTLDLCYLRFSYFICEGILLYSEAVAIFSTLSLFCRTSTCIQRFDIRLQTITRNRGIVWNPISREVQCFHQGEHKLLGGERLSDNVIQRWVVRKR